MFIVLEPGHETCQLPSRPVRVWTVLRKDEPFQPRHGENAFLEDFVHDWDYRNGTLRYYSRIRDINEQATLFIQ